MTLPLTVLLGYAAGLSLAMAAERPLKKSTDPISTRYFAVTAIVGATVFVPVGLATYATAPDWALMYLANPSHIPAGLALLGILVTELAAPMLGFLVAHRLATGGFEIWCRGQVFLAGLLAVATVVLGRARIGRVTHYESFHYGGSWVPLFGSKLSIALFVLTPIAAGAFVFILSEVRRHAQGRRTVSA